MLHGRFQFFKVCNLNLVFEPETMTHKTSVEMPLGKNM